MRFHTEFVSLTYVNLERGKQWWIGTFDCRESKLPNWDDPMPSDIALRFPQDDEPTIQLRAETDGRVDDEPAVSTIFCSRLKKAHEQLSGRGILVGPIQDGGDMKFFEIRDIEGHLIEICEDTGFLSFLS